MNRYIASCKEKRTEVMAETSYEAQLKAAKIFKVWKDYEITVVLAEKDGEQIVHVADF